MANQAKWYENYRVVQLSIETHTLLKEHCKKHGFKMSGLVEQLILNDIRIRNNITENKEQWKTKRLMEELFDIQMPEVESVTDYETIISEGLNKSK
jgi:hypothetical protein